MILKGKQTSTLITQGTNADQGLNTEDASDGRMKAYLADKVPVIVNGDYGADHAALSGKHLEMCAGKGIYIQVLPLSKHQ